MFAIMRGLARWNWSICISNVVGTHLRSIGRNFRWSLWIIARPPPREGRWTCWIKNPGGAMSSLIAGEASEVTHVSWSARTSMLLSEMISWILAALLTADRELKLPRVKFLKLCSLQGPGFVWMSPDDNRRSAVMIQLRQRHGLPLKGVPFGGRNQSNLPFSWMDMSELLTADDSTGFRTDLSRTASYSPVVQR